MCPLEAKRYSTSPGSICGKSRTSPCWLATVMEMAEEQAMEKVMILAAVHWEDLSTQKISHVPRQQQEQLVYSCSKFGSLEEKVDYLNKQAQQVNQFYCCTSTIVFIVAQCPYNYITVRIACICCCRLCAQVWDWHWRTDKASAFEHRSHTAESDRDELTTRHNRTLEVLAKMEQRVCFYYSYNKINEIHRPRKSHIWIPLKNKIKNNKNRNCMQYAINNPTKII